MRALALLILLAPAAAGAETLADTHFDRNFCWRQGFGREHLAAHPDQQVTAIDLSREPLGTSKAPGATLVEVRVRLRAERKEMVAIANCHPEDEGLRCRMDGRAGDFRLDGQGEAAVQLTVGERGMSFEGDSSHVLRADEGEDRMFLLGRCG